MGVEGPERLDGDPEGDTGPIVEGEHVGNEEWLAGTNTPMLSAFSAVISLKAKAMPRSGNPCRMSTSR